MSTLKFRVVPTTPIYTDAGSGAHLNVAIYEPQFPAEGGWYFLGHLALVNPLNKGYQDPSVEENAPDAILVQSDDPDALSPVKKLQQLWTDQHSHGDQNMEIWSFQATKSGDYHPVGLFASIVKKYGDDPTSQTSWSKLCAVRSDLLLPGNVGSMIWNDHGSHADGAGTWKNISLWHITGTGGILPTKTFLASENYEDPPTAVTPSAYLLREE